jgi:broad specificity phosphatase PhoE
MSPSGSSSSAKPDLILIRHGLTDWNEAGRLLGRLPVPLNARGRAEAEAVAAALREAPVSAVFSSPQLRAQQTAEPIAKVHRLEVRAEEALAEVWLGPRWEAKTFDDIHDDPDIARVFSDPTYRCDAAEAAADVQERVVGFVEQVRAKESGTAVLVSHGDPLRVLIAHYLSMPLAAFRALVVSNAGVTVLRFDGGGPHALLLNWRPSGRVGGWSLAPPGP